MAVEYAQHSRSPKKAMGVAVVAALALALAANSSTALNAQSVNISQPDSRVSIAVGRGKLITLPSPIEDIFIAENSIADVQVRSPRQIYILARKAVRPAFMLPARPARSSFRLKLRSVRKFPRSTRC